MLQIVKWRPARQDRNGDGLMEHGEPMPTRLWGLMISEPYNGFDWDRTQNDIVVVAHMEL